MLYMSRRAAQIVLSPEEQAAIEKWALGKRFPVRLVQRAQVILMAANGILNTDFHSELSVTFFINPLS
jgi:hypothetical protein